MKGRIRRGECNREKKGMQRKEGWENQIKRARGKNRKIDSRIMRVILAGVKARTSTFSFFPSVIYLAVELV